MKKRTDTTSAMFHTNDQVTQEAPLRRNPIRNVYFTSNTLPIQPTLVSPPKIVGDTTLSVGSVSGDLSNIIADYSIPVTAQND